MEHLAVTACEAYPINKLIIGGVTCRTVALTSFRQDLLVQALAFGPIRKDRSLAQHCIHVLLAQFSPFVATFMGGQRRTALSL